MLPGNNTLIHYPLQAKLAETYPLAVPQWNGIGTGDNYRFLSGLLFGIDGRQDIKRAHSNQRRWCPQRRVVKRDISDSREPMSPKHRPVKWGRYVI